MDLFAGFGSIAMLVFVDFGGSQHQRLCAYLALIVGGAALIALQFTKTAAVVAKLGLDGSGRRRKRSCGRRGLLQEWARR